MFDFTTTTFVHDAGMIEANPNQVNHQGEGASSQNMLRIGNFIFKYEDVVAIYRNPYIAPANAKLYVDVKGFMESEEAAEAKRFKLDFYLRRSGDNNSFYSNDFVFKGKDFHYEWTKKQNTAEKVAKMINKIIRLYGDVYLKVYTEEVDGNSMLVFENDNYGLFTEAQLKVYQPEISDCCTYREGDWEILDELDGPVHYCGEYTCDEPMLPYVTSKDNEDYNKGWLTAWQGVNGFGTYEQLIKDLRLPTMENLRWMSPTASEMPVPGNKYVQYTFHQISCRGVLGGSAVGEVTHSKTTHVFFVPACGCGDDLDVKMWEAIEAAGMKDLVLSTDGGTPKEPTLQGNGDEKPGTTKGTIISDSVTDPVIAEDGKFIHDTEIRAKTTNSTPHEAPVSDNQGQSEGGSEGNG